MPDIISTDYPLTRAQQILLAALLDTLVPASDDGAMPSAADVGFDAYLLAQAKDFVPPLISALQHFEPAFVELSLADRCERVREFSTTDPPLFQALLTRVYDCYYQNDRVRLQIGVVTRRAVSARQSRRAGRSVAARSGHREQRASRLSEAMTACDWLRLREG